MTREGGSGGSRRVWVYLAVVALLAFVGHEVGSMLWEREWESTDQSGDPELGGLYALVGAVGGAALAVVLVLAHVIARRRRHTDRP